MRHLGEKCNVNKHKMTKCERVQRRNLRSEHPRTKWKSGGGPKWRFPKLEEQQTMMGRCKYRRVGLREQWGNGKQLPFGQKHEEGGQRRGSKHRGTLSGSGATCSNKWHINRHTNKEVVFMWVRWWFCNGTQGSKTKSEKALPCLKIRVFHWLIKQTKWI